MTYDSWVSGITRPIVKAADSGPIAPLYFISYAFISAIIMANVLIAILVDKYTEAVREMAQEDAETDRDTVCVTEGEANAKRSSPEVVDELSRVRSRMSAQIQDIRNILEEATNAAEKKPKKCISARTLNHIETWTTCALPGQQRVKEIFNSEITQIFLTVVIFINFLVAAVEAQFCPPWMADSDDTHMIFDMIDHCFNFFFLAELLANIYGNFMVPFLRNPWNYMDGSIVVVSLATSFTSEVDVTVLRLFRAFRRAIVAFRIVKLLRLEWVRMVVLGVLKALPGVMNAFILLGLVMGIWSIMAVNFFSEHHPEFFGNFAQSMLSMMQIMSFDSWSSQITRPVILQGGSWEEADKGKAFIGIIFFITYVFASAIIMANVVLAILIDKFLACAKDMMAEAEREKEKALAKAAAAEAGDACSDPMREAEDPVVAFGQLLHMELCGVEEYVRGPFRDGVIMIHKRAGVPFQRNPPPMRRHSANSSPSRSSSKERIGGADMAAGGGGEGGACSSSTTAAGPACVSFSVDPTSDPGGREGGVGESSTRAGRSGSYESWSSTDSGATGSRSGLPSADRSTLPHYDALSHDESITPRAGPESRARSGSPGQCLESSSNSETAAPGRPAQPAFANSFSMPHAPPCGMTAGQWASALAVVLAPLDQEQEQRPYVPGGDADAAAGCRGGTLLDPEAEWVSAFDEDFTKFMHAVDNRELMTKVRAPSSFPNRV